MAGRDGWSQEAKDRATRAHARHSEFCTCGRIVFGNGGKASHRYMHEKAGDGHHGISADEYVRRGLVDKKREKKP